MKILSIGNSFSQDAQRYLKKIADSEGVDMKTVNLYIGGCSLETHFNNILNDAPDYDYQLNGKPENRNISIREALESDSWDYITLQQASHFSFDFNTYDPYLEEISAYLKKNAPGAKQVIHQTWNYADDSPRLNGELPFKTGDEMFKPVEEAYDKAAKLLNLPLIPSGKIFYECRHNGIEPLYRDGFHASFGLGRFILGCVWFEFFTGKRVSEIDFSDFDEPVDLIMKKKALEITDRYFENI